RPTGVGAEGDRREAGGHRRGRAAARTAGHLGEAVGVAGGADRRVLRRAAHGELVEVGLADGDGARRGEARDDGGVVGRQPPVEDLRRAGGGHATGAEVVLQRDGYTGERAGVLPRRDAPVDLVGRRSGGVRGDDVERVDVGLTGLDGGEVLVAHLTGGALAGPDGRGELECGGHGASPSTGGTRNWPSSAAGAWASTSSRSRV